jgi:hypothetical protein
MAEQYFYGRNDTSFGPYSALELRTLAVAGTIRPNDSVWRRSNERRSLASNVKNLFPPAETPAEPLPAAVPPPADPPASVVEPPPAPSRPAEKPRPKRVTAITGATLVGQDGHSVKFVKKCDKCKYEDRNRSTAVIRAGSTRVPFFCPKCRRGRYVVITGVG